MNPFTITLTHAQANFIFNAISTHTLSVQNQANELIKYLDSEFKKVNSPEQPEQNPEQPSND